MKKIILLSIFLVLIAAAGGYALASMQESPVPRSTTAQEVESERRSAGLHYSFFSEKEFFETAYRQIPQPSVTAPANIKGIVVPHHLLAAANIAEAMQTVTSEAAITVVLISPNHFFRGKGQITTSIYDWQTPYGILEADQTLIEELHQQQLAVIDEAPFKEEHGISNLVAFIKKNLPHGRIIPLIVKDTLSTKRATAFQQAISDFLPPNTLWVASIDFSHYLPNAVADFHDETSLAVLRNLDDQSVDQLEIDARPSLNIFLQALKAESANQFHLYRHSNAAQLINDPDLSETTSHFTGAFSIGELAPAPQATVLAFGDIMLDRYIRQRIEQQGQEYPFEKMERVLMGNDLNLANLEGCFTDAPPKPLHPNNTTFTFDPNVASTLARLDLSLMSLANNHTRDFGNTGFEQCKATLGAKGIDFFGDPLNQEQLSITKTVRGMKLGFVGYNELSHSDLQPVLDEIQRLDPLVDHVIVMPHWGNEYQPIPSSKQQRTAHQFIDAGADLVLGSHPHVIQPIEIYNNKLIVYSMGNFLFDQTFSDATQQGLAIGLVLQPQQLDAHLIPIVTRNLQTQLADPEKRDMILSELSKRSDGSAEIKQQITLGKFQLQY